MHAIINKALKRARANLSWSLVIFIILSLIGHSFSYEVSTISKASRQRQNNPPEAVISSPENAQVYEVNEIIHFDASESSDPDNDPLTYTWNFGDGDSGEGVQTTHAYSIPWVPIITLTVSDGDAENTDRVVIVIGSGGGQNRPPRASIDSPSNFDTFSIDESILFDGSSSSDSDEGTTLTFLWDFGDGNTSSGSITTHAYSELKPYRVKLTVSDGMFNDSERIVIFVNNTPPTADAGEDQTGYPGKLLKFDGTNSSDPDRFGSIENYTWDMGDKTTKYGPVIYHSYSRYGSFKVTLTVTDNNGATGSDELKVIITNAVPVASLKLSSPDTYLDKDIEFDATASFDPDGEVEEYYYIFGDGAETDWVYDSKVIHRYSSKGEYEIVLKVKDDRSEVSEPVSLFINVVEKINKPPSLVITYPLEDDSVAGKVSIKGTASDPDNEIEEIELKIDEDNWDEANIVGTIENGYEWEYEWDTEDVNDGEHLITARAYDGEDFSPEIQIKVEVNNRPTTYIELTEELKPATVKPNDKVTVSGDANYDTNVPVTGARIEILIIETNRKWVTQTNAQGKYSYDIKAPDSTGRFTVQVSISDGTLEREISKKLTVKLDPPDIVINADDISFSKTKPVEKQIVEITIRVHNTGGSDATGSISFYLDTIESSNLFDRKDISIPTQKTILVKSNWTSKKGTHDIVIFVSDVIPEEADETNNKANKRILVTVSDGDTDEKVDEGLLEQFNNLSPMYKYGIIFLIIIIILIIIIAVISSISKSNKAKEQMCTMGTMGSGETQQTGRTDKVVFKPLQSVDDNNAKNFKNTRPGYKLNNQGSENINTNAKLGKFETIGIR